MLDFFVSALIGPISIIHLSCMPEASYFSNSKMENKTPQFDRALDEYFSRFERDGKNGSASSDGCVSRGGQWRKCRFSGEKFCIRPEDIGFYKRIRVPLPTLSPRERMRLRLSFWNSYNLYTAISSFSGKKIITQYPSGTPYKIYEHQIWFGEEWNSLSYGLEYDESRSFF